MLAAGPDGKLYVAAGDTVATVDPAARQVTHRIFLTAGRATSVAVSPDGSKLYVGVAPSGSFQLLIYDLATGIQDSSSQMSVGGAGNLVATDGGVWGTTRHRDERVGLVRPRRRPGQLLPGQPGRGSRVQFGARSTAAAWSGSAAHTSSSAPARPRARAGAHAHPHRPRRIVEYFDSPTVLSSGRAYALYQDNAAHLAGVASLTPPAACSG